MRQGLSFSRAEADDKRKQQWIFRRLHARPRKRVYRRQRHSQGTPFIDLRDHSFRNDHLTKERRKQVQEITLKQVVQRRCVRDRSGIPELPAQFLFGEPEGGDAVAGQFLRVSDRP